MKLKTFKNNYLFNLNNLDRLFFINTANIFRALGKEDCAILWESELYRE